MRANRRVLASMASGLGSWWPAAPLDRSTVDAVAIYILDQQAGPFRLAMRAIR